MKRLLLVIRELTVFFKAFALTVCVEMCSEFPWDELGSGVLWAFDNFLQQKVVFSVNMNPEGLLFFF